MNENLNLAKILKDCPKGTKLYSLIYGDVKLESVRTQEGYSISYRTKSNEIFWVTSNGKAVSSYNGECTLFPSREQRDWSKFKPLKPKFDPMTLKPFDKVLARETVKCQWRCTFYSNARENIHKYVTTDYTYKYCIPYNDDTKHLVGTLEEAPEFYRYWED